MQPTFVQTGHAATIQFDSYEAFLTLYAKRLSSKRRLTILGKRPRLWLMWIAQSVKPEDQDSPQGYDFEVIDQSAKLIVTPHRRQVRVFPVYPSASQA